MRDYPSLEEKYGDYPDLLSKHIFTINLRENKIKETKEAEDV